MPGVVAQDVDYNHLQYSAGALSGVVDLDASATFDDVLRATATRSSRARSACPSGPPVPTSAAATPDLALGLEVNP